MTSMQTIVVITLGLLATAGGGLAFVLSRLGGRRLREPTDEELAFLSNMSVNDVRHRRWQMQHSDRPAQHEKEWWDNGYLWARLEREMRDNDAWIVGELGHSRLRHHAVDIVLMDRDGILIDAPRRSGHAIAK